MEPTTRDKLNEQLKHLALIAQQHLPLTQERQLALGRLVQTILKSGRLCRPQRGKFTQCYEEIYEEARQELMFYICQNVEKYDPQRGEVMAWCNVLLERRFFKEAVPQVLNRQGTQIMSLVDLETLAIPDEPPIFAELLKEYIELDPENLFKNTYVRDHPAANFQVLAKQRLEGKSWKKISEHLNLKISTLSRFYCRCLDKFASQLKDATTIV